MCVVYVLTEIWDCDCFWHNVRSHLDRSQLASGLWGGRRFFFFLWSIFFFFHSVDSAGVHSNMKINLSKAQRGLIHFPRCYEKTFYITFIKTVTTAHLSLSYTAAPLCLPLCQRVPRLSFSKWTTDNPNAWLQHNGCYCIWQSIWRENLKQKTPFNPCYPLTSWKPLMGSVLGTVTPQKYLGICTTVHTFPFPSTINLQTKVNTRLFCNQNRIQS